MLTVASRYFRLLSSVLAAIVAGSCRDTPPTSHVDHNLEAARLTDRVAEARTSVEARWQPCRTRTSSERPGCDVSPIPASELSHALATATAMATALASSPRTVQLHRRALIDLRFASHEPAALDRAVASLSDVAASNQDPHLLNDLAVALLIRADTRANLLDYLAALDAASKAVTLAPEWPPARFNQALIMGRLELRHSVRAAWRRLVAIEPDSLWRKEAEAHLAAASTSNGAAIAWSQGVALDAVPAYVRQSPQQAREYGLTTLAAWGSLVRAGNADSARTALSLARAIGAALTDMDGDRSLPATVAQIDDVVDLRFAAPFAQLKRAVTFLENGAYDDGRTHAIASRLALQRLNSPMWRWAAFYAAFGHINTSQYDAAEAELRRALRAIPYDQPALQGKLIWALGVTELRRGKYDAAVRLYREAKTHLERSQETQNIGGISYLLTEALNLAGRTVEGAREALTGLHALADFDRSDYLNDHLHNVAALARRHRLRSAGLAIANEVVETARLAGRPQVIAWAMRDRASDHLSLDDTAAATQDLREGYEAARSLKHGVGRERVTANLDLVLASSVSRRRPDSAATIYRNTIDSYNRLHLVNYVPNAMTEASRNALAMHDTVAAATYLHDAMRIVDGQSAGFENSAVRSSFSESLDAVYDSAIELDLARMNPMGALGILMRAQLAPWRGAARVRTLWNEEVPALDHVTEALQPREAVVVYAVLREQLVIWIASGAGWRSITRPISRRDIASLVSAGVRSMSNSRAQSDSSLAQLYDMLVRPALKGLSNVTTLVIVPDYDLGRLPFAALIDTASGRYLVEDFEIRSVPSLAFLGRNPRSKSNTPSALVVGTHEGFAELPTLPSAAEEARAVASTYRWHMLRDESVSVAALKSAMQEYSIFHFAGHAVTNSEEPELSFLAISPLSSMTGQQIAKMRLNSMDVAVLSACSTQGAAGRRGGMTSGLTFSFLLAGAGATISSLWDISDQDTKALQVTLHRKLANGTPAPRALREAQLGMLFSGDPKLRRPYAWAAFVVSGR